MYNLFGRAIVTVARSTEHQAVETRFSWLVIGDGLPRNRLEDDFQVQQTLLILTGYSIDWSWCTGRLYWE